MNSASKRQADTETAREIYRQLLTQTRSLILGTTNPDGTPLTSYAPFIVDDQRQFTIFTSQLAAHTANLQQTSQASVMLIEDEAAASQIFARRRVTFQCRASLIPRDSVAGAALLADYETRFGKMVGLLKSLPDFQIFQLQPQTGSLVIGFAQAYALSGERFEIIIPPGHNG
ncbi:MAG: pyridoxamine 5'-phosphate oxidase family protein [Anaerolineae bacterium]|nr:pyridoxamine 5'-phosphate oxidase family protein [Anaerolineae bacterium]